MCPFKQGVLNKDGEFVLWNPEQMVAMVLKSFGKIKPRSILYL